MICPLRSRAANSSSCRCSDVLPPAGSNCYRCGSFAIPPIEFRFLHRLEFLRAAQHGPKPPSAHTLSDFGDYTRSCMCGPSIVILLL
ncbi:hypothetical protein ACP70R_009273 [Stipagrostis hirtigluma subsp. patula]